MCVDLPAFELLPHAHPGIKCRRKMHPKNGKARYDLVSNDITSQAAAVVGSRRGRFFGMGVS